MALLKLTERISKGYGSAEFTTQTILIETNQIIKVETKTMKSGNAEYEYTKIESVGAMVTITHVTETPKEIFKMYQKQLILNTEIEENED